MRARVLVAAAILLAGSPPAEAGVAPYAVEVVSNYFSPSRLTISAGESVRWVARDAGHAVQADDGRFRFPPTGTFAVGDTATFTFTTDDEWVRYHCAVHPEMRGAIKVGNPPLVGDDQPTEIRAVPGEYPTIADALDGIPVGAAVDLAPGVYDTSILLEVDGVRLRGTGESPAGVVLRGEGIRGVGVTGRASGVQVENLTLSGYTVAGIDMIDADHFIVDRVGVEMALDAGNGGSYGIHVRASRHGRIHGVEVSHAEQAAIQADECSPCDLLVDRSIMRAGTVGFAARKSSYLIVRSSTIEDNVTGIALSSGGPDEPDGGVHVVGNTLRRNTARFTRRPTAPLELAPGIGVWIDGFARARVEDNTLDGHRYGIALTGLGGPSLASTIVGNHIGGSSEADLAWDGIGAGSCFDRNTGSEEGSPSSEPPQIERLYPCSGAAPRPGIPLPLVTANVILGGTP